MPMSVYPELMDKISPDDVDTSLRTIEAYIRYITERTEFAFTNTFRTTTSLGASAEALSLVLEDQVNKLSEASTQINGLAGAVESAVGLIGGKVDKEEGKGLSSNDYTDEDKAKLDSLEPGGEANVIETVKRNGTALPVTDKAVDIAVPTMVSELTNDSGFQTSQQVQSAVSAGVSGKADAAELTQMIAFLADHGLYYYPVILQEPQDVTIAAGQTAYFPFQAGGDGLTYEWWYRNPNTTGGDFRKSTNATDTYSIKASASSHSQGFFVYCVVTDQRGNTVQTRTAALTLAT